MYGKKTSKNGYNSIISVCITPFAILRQLHRQNCFYSYTYVSIFVGFFAQSFRIHININLIFLFCYFCVCFSKLSRAAPRPFFGACTLFFPRFILYTVPMLNVAAAYILSLMWNKGYFARMAVVGGLAVNLICE